MNPSVDDNSDAVFEVPEVPEVPDPPTPQRGGRSRRRSNKIKSYVSAASFVTWLGFILVWLFFFAEPYGVYENIGIALASFIIIAGLNGSMWTPRSAQHSGRIQFSIFSLILLLTFIVLWLPFANNILGDFSTLSRNLAILLGVSLLFIFLNGGVWVTTIPVTGMGGREKGSIGILGLWLGFLVYWMWFQADITPWNINAVYVLLSTIISSALILGAWVPEMRREGGQIGWFGIGLLYVWLILMVFWFQFFAPDFIGYQNIAVVVASFLAMVAIAVVTGYNKWKGVDSFDWDD